MKFTATALALSLAIGAPTFAFAASEGETLIKQRIEDAGFNTPRRIGVMVGGRHYCGIDVKQFLSMFRTRIEFTQQTPEHDWNRMVRSGNATVEALRKSSTPCDAAFKSYLERLSY